MYNPVTTNLISNAPEIQGIDLATLPDYLTKVYTKIISVRAKLGHVNMRQSLREDVLELRKLANNLETFSVLQYEHPNLASAAFVAGTAHHLLQLIYEMGEESLTSESIPSMISSIILFLIGDSPADAAEVASGIEEKESVRVKEQLYNAITFLAKGQIGRIRAIEISTSQYQSESEEAEEYLWECVLLGLQQMAEALLGIGLIETDYFGKVAELSMSHQKFLNDDIQSCYSGPYHLSRLLVVLQQRLLGRGVVNVPAPKGIQALTWSEFLRRLAQQRPYLWENHFDAINTGFLDRGNSAVLAFPTGAGKTTVSELKIASAIMSGLSILYLVPTHALEDQVTRELGRLFDNLSEDILEVGAEFTLLEEEKLSQINVMTPERCLTLLSMDPAEFGRIGLIVFDEFHLINAKEDKIDKRSLDAMFCLLRLFSDVPDCDYLLISAMVENSEEIADWVKTVTNRNCEVFNSKWKPTRQLQGCIVYPEKQIDYLDDLIKRSRGDQEAGTGPRVLLKRSLKAIPHQLFSVRNVWEADRPNEFFLRKFFHQELTLGISNYWTLTSNRNQIAAHVAAYFVNQGMKTLLFVDNPVVAKSTAKYLEGQLENKDMDSDLFRNSNARRIDSLALELGDIKYSYFNVDRQVAAHHGLLLPLERYLNESYFKQKNGLDAIVATATLAQGINLPAEVVVIAGDDRFDDDLEIREALQPHEILNTAGRAGRAGSSAQGIVLLVPGKVIKFNKKSSNAPQEWIDLRKKIFSKNDQCLKIEDPLKQFLDEISSGRDELDDNVNNLLLRLHNEDGLTVSAGRVLRNSLSAYRAQKNQDATFADKINRVISKRASLGLDFMYDSWVEATSLKTGITPRIIEKIGTSLSEIPLVTLFGFGMEQWISWLLEWLLSNPERIIGVFPSPSAHAQLARALGLSVTRPNVSVISEKIKELEPLLICYINGGDYKTIDDLIAGNSDEFLSRARHFVLRLIPHFSFAMGAVSLTLVEKLRMEEYDIEQVPLLTKQLATMMREGFDTEEKLHFKLKNRSYLRVQCHNEFLSE